MRSGILKEGPLRKRFRNLLNPQGTPLDEDIFLDLVWALQDIAIIRALADFKDTPRVVATINEYFHMLLDHLLATDLPRHGMTIEDVNEAKNLIEKARASPIDSKEFDSYLAGADGTFSRFLDEYIERYCKNLAPTR